MADYKSRYTGQEIDNGIGKAYTALQEHQSLKTINNQSLVGTGNIEIEPGVTDHDELNKLDYENSGHTGFQAEIEDLDDIRSGAELGATAVQDSDYVHTDNNFTDEEKAKLSELENYDDTEIKEDISDLGTSIDTINSKIPSQATSQNKLADKNFVNSSIATNTAYFKGTYENVEDLPTTDVTNNDYAYIVIYDETEIDQVKQYDRYKYSTEDEWQYEYTLNNSSFTAEQWETINSGITYYDIEKLSTIEEGAQVNTIESIVINGIEQPIEDKSVNIDVASSADIDELIDWKSETGTNITIDNAIPFRFRTFDLNGKSTQFRSTGKNELRLNNYNGTFDTDTDFVEFGNHIELKMIMNGSAVITSNVNDFHINAGNLSEIYYRMTNLKPNTTYTISCTGEVLHWGGATNIHFLETYHQKSDFVDNKVRFSRTFMTDSNGNYEPYAIVYQSFFSTLGYKLELVTHDFQLEEGSSSSSFEPYFDGESPSPEYPQNITSLTSLDNFADVLITDGDDNTKTISLYVGTDKFCSVPNGVCDKFYINTKTGEYGKARHIDVTILDGMTEPYSSLLHDEQSTFELVYEIPGYKNSTTSKNILSTHFIYDYDKCSSQYLHGYISGTGANERIRLIVNQSIATTVEEFNNWLHTHHVTIQYERAWVEYEPIGMLDKTELEDLKTYLGINNITSTGFSENPVIELEYADYIGTLPRINDVKVNGVSVVENRVANINVPIKVSDLTNDSEYLTLETLPIWNGGVE